MEIVTYISATLKIGMKCDDSILLRIPKAVEPDILPEDIPLDILYEDDDLLILPLMPPTFPIPYENARKISDPYFISRYFF